MSKKAAGEVVNTIPLHDAVKLIMKSFDLRQNNVEHGVFYIIGAPGGGKTKSIMHECAKHNITFLNYSPALERIEKFGGIPDITWKEYGEGEQKRKELHTVWSVPQMIGEIREAAKHKNSKVLVLFDDWHLCDETMQAIGFELFTYYSLNGHAIPSNVVFCLAGNKTSAAGARVQLSAIRNRCVAIEVKPDIKHWLQNYAIPNNLHETCISFFSFDAHSSFFHEEESTTSQFASPRSWTHFFNLMEEMEKSEVINGNSAKNKNLLNAVCEGCVGKVAASKFFEFYRIYLNVDPEKYFKNGHYDKKQFPAEPLDQYALSSATTFCYHQLLVELYHDYKKNEKSKISEKEFQSRFMKISQVFEEILTTFKEKNKGELTSKTLTMLFHKKSDENTGFPGGHEIVKKLMRDKILDSSSDMVKNVLSIATQIESYKGN